MDSLGKSSIALVRDEPTEVIKSADAASKTLLFVKVFSFVSMLSRWSKYYRLSVATIKGTDTA